MLSSYHRHLRPWTMLVECSIWLAGRGCGMAYVDRDHVVRAWSAACSGTGAVAWPMWIRTMQWEPGVQHAAGRLWHGLLARDHVVRAWSAACSGTRAMACPMKDETSWLGQRWSTEHGREVDGVVYAGWAHVTWGLKWSTGHGVDAAVAWSMWDGHTISK